MGWSVGRGLVTQFLRDVLSLLSGASLFTPRWKGSEKPEVVNPRRRSVILVVGREVG